jgi:hypothetical protein
MHGSPGRSMKRLGSPTRNGEGKRVARETGAQDQRQPSIALVTTAPKVAGKVLVSSWEPVLSIKELSANELGPMDCKELKQGASVFITSEAVGVLGLGA